VKTRLPYLALLVALLAISWRARRSEPEPLPPARTALALPPVFPQRPAASPPVAVTARETRVAIDDEMFTGKRSPFWQAAEAGRVALTLPDGRAVEVVIERTEWRGEESFVSRGRLDGYPGSLALFAYARGEVAGYVNAPPLGEFQLSGSTRRGEATLAATGGLECPGPIAAPPREHPAAARDHAEEPAPPVERAASGLPVTIDVLGLYLSDSFGPGTTEDVARANFDLNIELCNRCFANSEIPLRMRLVRVAPTSYRETITTDQIRLIGDALEALRRRDDGQMDEIHALRDEAGADLVFLAMSRFAAGAGGPSGMSYIQYFPSVRSPRDWEANPGYGFCVVKARADNNFSALPHEFGHNFGCAHDRPNAGTGGGAFPYSFAHKFTAQNGLRYRTIMAYGPTFGTEYSTLLFSNPRLVPAAYGVPVGVAEGAPDAADNAQTIMRAMFEIAAFRMNADAPTRHRLVNVATRAWAGAGGEALIGGFIVAGDAPSPVVVRVLGPSLASFGMRDTLADPLLEVRRAGDGGLVLRNDNWASGDVHSVAALRASGLAPGNGLEPATFLTLPPGGYTAVVSAADGRAGHGIVEVFGIAGGAGEARLSNLSTRAPAGGEGREMIGGFVVEGAPGETKRIAIRALGPSLRDYGVGAVLDDPLIELHDSSGALILVQDDFNSWDPATGGRWPPLTYAQAGVLAAGLQPGNRREPCVMLDLAAGAYSVVVRPAPGTTPGVALLEVFEVRPAP